MKTIETFKYLRPFLKRKIKQNQDYGTVQLGHSGDDFIHNRQRLVLTRKVGLYKESIQFIIFQDFENKCYKHIEL